MLFKIEEGVLVQYNRYGDNGITEVTVPDGVSVIGSWAFSSSKSLERIILPDSIVRYQHNALCGIQVDTLSVPYTRTLELAFDENRGYVNTLFLRIPEDNVRLKLCIPDAQRSNLYIILREFDRKS